MSSNAPSASKGPPIGLVFFLSLGAAIIWIGALLYQISTSEAQVMGHSSGGLAILDAFNQWTYFAHGQLSMSQSAAFIYAWGLEIFVLLAVVMYEIMSHAFKRGHSMLPRIFGGLIVLCFLLDAGSDFMYLSASLGIWTRLIVSGLIAAAVAFLGVAAAAGFEHCYKNW